MNNFTQIISESRKNYDSESILSAEISEYLSKVNKVIPATVKDVIHLTQKFNLLDKVSIEEIRLASKGALKQLSKKFNIELSQLEDLWRMLKDLKTNIRMLPQYQSPQEREMIEKGKLAMNELTIDLDTKAGRDAAAKIYMPIAYKIVNQFVGKSKFSKQELMSSALEGMVHAMNNWKRDGSGVAFKTYLSYRIQQQILYDINKHSHALSGFNDYAYKKGYSADAISLDGFLTSNGDEFNQDRLSALGVEDDNEFDRRKVDLEDVYKAIDANFSSRDAVMFYRYYGRNGYKQEKAKVLAKELGMSESNFSNMIVRKILNFLRNKFKSEVFESISAVYNESLMISLLGMDRDSIIETLISDDVFIMLEELNKWNDKNLFKSSLQTALSSLSDIDSKYITDVLKNDFEFLDGEFKKHKKVIILFLNNMYPTEPMNRKSDVALLDYMVDIQDAYKKHIK